MDISKFRKHGHDLVDWMADYLENIRDLPVRSNTQPGNIKKQIPGNPPKDSESFDSIMRDFNAIIIPGMTHWQHPSFHAYFPANSSPPSVLAEMLTATLGAQCMIWQTSPAAAELEEMMMRWLAKMIGLPKSFDGVIQDTASTATLCAILSAREKISGFEINKHGYPFGQHFAIYCSTETHSSIDKAVKIAGLGSDSIRRIKVDKAYAMIPGELDNAIAKDLAEGITPLCVIATLGTTSSTAVDPLKPIGDICAENSIWLHVDAAYAGSALVLPEMRWMIDGIEQVDSFVFNPHKWMLTNFDCSAYFVKSKETLIRTFEIMPEYLKTPEDQRVNNYRDWGVPLGRRFRALKLWFVIRSYGVSGIQKIIKGHINMAQWLKNEIDRETDFEMLAPVPFGLVCFRYHPQGAADEERLDEINHRILETVNATGKIYITHTKLQDRYCLRFSIGQAIVTRDDVEMAWKLIKKTARETNS